MRLCVLQGWNEKLFGGSLEGLACEDEPFDCLTVCRYVLRVMWVVIVVKESVQVQRSGDGEQASLSCVVVQCVEQSRSVVCRRSPVTVVSW